MQKIVVIGGGISGLASAYLIQQQAKLANLPVQLTLLEKEARVGGKVWSKDHDGYLCEWGANGFLTNKPQTLQLCNSLALTKELLASNDNARKRYIYAADQLHRLPRTLGEFIRASILSWSGKCRLAGEIFIPQSRSTSDESVTDFAHRRLGAEVLNRMIAPMASGIFAGNPDTMSLVACFPRIKQLEQEYGSLINALLCVAWQKFVAPVAKPSLVGCGGVVGHGGPASHGGPAGPGGVLTSFVGGLQVLTDSLRTAIGPLNIIQSAEVTNLEVDLAGRYQIYTTADVLPADKVVCSAPAHAASKIFADFDSELAQHLAEISYSPLVVVCFGYARGSVPHDLNGFGYLLARGESIPLLGTLWDSSIFINRAPEGRVLFRSMLGGASQPQLIELSDSEIQKMVQDSLYKIMGIRAEPEMVQIFRHQQAIPNYKIGHLQRIAGIESLVSSHRGLFLNGNAYHGVGINDCVASAYKTSAAIFA